jgi:hypothetical protein
MQPWQLSAGALVFSGVHAAGFVLFSRLNDGA